MPLSTNAILNTLKNEKQKIDTPAISAQYDEELKMDVEQSPSPVAQDLSKHSENNVVPVENMDNDDDDNDDEDGELHIVRYIPIYYKVRILLY